MPSVVLSVVSSGGNLGTIIDTRKQAGAVSTSNSSFPLNHQHKNTTVTVAFDKITKTQRLFSTFQQIQEKHLHRLLQFVWSNTGNVGNRFKDTIIHPAINLLASGTVSVPGSNILYFNKCFCIRIN